MNLILFKNNFKKYFKYQKNFKNLTQNSLQGLQPFKKAFNRVKERKMLRVKKKKNVKEKKIHFYLKISHTIFIQ
jgi:hypothetical protein